MSFVMIPDAISSLQHTASSPKTELLKKIADRWHMWHKISSGAVARGSIHAGARALLRAHCRLPTRKGSQQGLMGLFFHGLSNYPVYPKYKQPKLYFLPAPPNYPLIYPKYPL